MAKVLMDATDTVTQVVSRLPPGASPDITPAWPTEGAHSLLITSAGGAGNWQAQSPGGTSGQPVLPGDLGSAAADGYKIGRASCRGRVEISVGAVSLKKKRRWKRGEQEEE